MPACPAPLASALATLRESAPERPLQAPGSAGQVSLRGAHRTSKTGREATSPCLPALCRRVSFRARGPGSGEQAPQRPGMPLGALRAVSRPQPYPLRVGESQLRFPEACQGLRGHRSATQQKGRTGKTVGVSPHPASTPAL